MRHSFTLQIRNMDFHTRSMLQGRDLGIAICRRIPAQSKANVINSVSQESISLVRLSTPNFWRRRGKVHLSSHGNGRDFRSRSPTWGFRRRLNCSILHDLHRETLKTFCPAVCCDVHLWWQNYLLWINVRPGLNLQHKSVVQNSLSFANWNGSVSR